MRSGKWKIVSIFPSDKWELYNIEKDRGETKDLAQSNPEIVNQLAAKYLEWTEKTGVVEYNKLQQGNEFIPGAADKRK